MTSKSRDIAGTHEDAELIQPTSVISPADGTASLAASEIIGALSIMVKTVSEVHQVHQVEKTKRAKLKAYRDTEVARIKASERMLREYFDRIFAERQQVHRKLFDTLDHALETGDATMAQVAVQGIVDVASESPLENVGDLRELSRAMADPDTVFEL